MPYHIASQTARRTLTDISPALMTCYVLQQGLGPAATPLAELGAVAEHHCNNYGPRTLQKEGPAEKLNLL